MVGVGRPTVTVFLYFSDDVAGVRASQSHRDKSEEKPANKGKKPPPMLEFQIIL